VYGLGLRITIIMSLSLLVLLLGATAVFIIQHHREDTGFRLPLPAQVGAISALVEETPVDRLPDLLTAVNSENLLVSVQSTPPDSSGSRAAPALSWALRNYITASSGRPIEAMFLKKDDRSVPTLQRDAENGLGLGTSMPLRLVVTLKDGRYLVLETRRGYLDRFTGIRLVLILLLLAIVISSLTLWFLRRQIRPIEQLAALVERVGPDSAGHQISTAPIDVSSLSAKGGKETRQLAAAINRMQDRIRSLLSGRSRMLASISHDLGTYLTRLRLRSEFISDAAQREAAIRDIEDMDALISNTMVLAEIEQNREPVQMRDIVDLVRRQVASHASSGSPVRFHTSIDNLEMPLRPIAINRALGNLISNALRYGNEADVTISRAGGNVLLLVEDRGPGIPAADREIVLEAFHRRDAARNLDRRGFGLGLAIVNDILRQHGGSLAFADRPGGGLRVTVTLPVTDAVPS
jgi:signal transduction histidine kinase